MTTATFHPFPADSSRAPMNACRQNLAAAIAALADEIQILEETMRPTVRLGELGLDLEQLDREIAALKVPHEQRVGNWIAAGQVGERPQPSLRISTLEARRRLLAGDVAAPEHVRPQAEAAHQRASVAVRERQAERECAAVLLSPSLAAPARLATLRVVGSGGRYNLATGGDRHDGRSRRPAPQPPIWGNALSIRSRSIRRARC